MKRISSKIGLVIALVVMGLAATACEKSTDSEYEIRGVDKTKIERPGDQGGDGVDKEKVERPGSQGGN